MNSEAARTARHEASHAAAAVLAGRPVEFISREIGHAHAGERLGHCRVVGDRVNTSQILVALVGYMATDTPGWPPPYVEALTEPKEGLGGWLRLLRVREPRYRELVDQASALVADARFRKLRDALARALGQVPHLTAETVNRIAEIHGIPTPEQEPAHAAA